MLWPGVGVALAVAVPAWALAKLVPVASPLLVTVLVGALVTNTIGVADALRPGLAFTGKKLLRVGIVLLGLQVSLRDIADLGIGMLGVVVAVVVGGLVTAEFAGRALGIRPPLRSLIGAGFSICGAAAVAGVEGVLPERRQEDVVTAIALVVVFGTSMIALVPLVAAALGLDPHTAGLWAGASVHEVAQVVAVGGIVGHGALAVAVVVKLARVLMLAPVAIWFGRRARLQGHDREGARTPLVPLFVLGFLAAVLLRTTGMIPNDALTWASAIQTVLLAAAMFALGCDVRFSTLRQVGGRPVGLAAIVTVAVSAIAAAGVALVA